MGPISDAARRLGGFIKDLKSNTKVGSPEASDASRNSPSTPSESSPSATRARTSPGGSFRLGAHDRLSSLMKNNRKWAAERTESDPTYFDRLISQQNPEYLWIGCADSRVPANVILGLEPGEVFTQRNVGNQSSHTDLNVMACLEYAVKELKVKIIICCGHYGCGAVKAALKLPSKTQGLVNCWISDIRECRNQHHLELKALSPEEQVDRLCELNVMRQTFHVCTSPVVQNAWDQGQELAVFGVIYSLKDGLLRKLVGPLTADNECLDIMEYEESMKLEAGLLPTNLPDLLPAMMGSVTGRSHFPARDLVGREEQEEPQSPNAALERRRSTLQGDDIDHVKNTAKLVSKLALHTAWDEANTPEH